MKELTHSAAPECTSTLPNVYMKVSGLVENYGENAPDDVEVYRKILDHAFQAFGEDRVMYGTNWPVCEMGAPIATAHKIALTYVSERGQEVVDKFFWKNAKAIYKWVDR